MLVLNLKKIMDEKHLSIQNVYEDTGISRNTISLLYNQKSKGIQFSTLTKLANYLDVDLEDLFTEKNKDYGSLNFVIHYSNSQNILNTLNYHEIITPTICKKLDEQDYTDPLAFIDFTTKSDDDLRDNGMFYSPVFRLPVYISYSVSNQTFWFASLRDRFAEYATSNDLDNELKTLNGNFDEYKRQNKDKELETVFGTAIIRMISGRFPRFRFKDKPKYIGFLNDFGNYNEKADKFNIRYIWDSSLLFSEELFDDYISEKYSEF